MHSRLSQPGRSRPSGAAPSASSTKYEVQRETDWRGCTPSAALLRSAAPPRRAGEARAEGVGFEPTVGREPHSSFQDCHLRPLGHPSMAAAQLPQYETQGTSYDVRRRVSQTVRRGCSAAPPRRAGEARAEGAGFEPAREREPPTRFPGVRTRPDYAIPPIAT